MLLQIWCVKPLQMVLLINHWQRTDCFRHFFHSCVSTQLTLQIFYYKYTFFITYMLLIIIRLLVYNYYEIYYNYARFHLSPVEHKKFRSKVELKGNSTKFFKIPVWRYVKNKISNKCCLHLPKSCVGKRKINCKYIKKINC